MILKLPVTWLCTAEATADIRETQPRGIHEPSLHFTTPTMEKPDEILPYETEFPLPPTYEKADEIQEFDASGQLVSTVTVLLGSLVKDHGYSYEDSSLLSDEFLAKYPESRVDISVSCISIIVDMIVSCGGLLDFNAYRD